MKSRHNGRFSSSKLRPQSCEIERQACRSTTALFNIHSSKHKTTRSVKSTELDYDELNQPNMVLKIIGICCLAAFILYINTYNAEFAFDDHRAILKNPDVDSSTPWLDVWKNDFWGTPINHSGSHKSYRPLCVLTFKLNHLIHQLEPGGYHLVNVLLHITATALFAYLTHATFHQMFITLVSGLMFATHPIHTEAVAGVVGRADVLCANFYLLTILSYANYMNHDEKSGLRKISWLMVTLILSLCAMLSKEVGITVLGVCLLYHIFAGNRRQLSNMSLNQLVEEFSSPVIICTAGTVLLWTIRLQLAGSNVPTFSSSDNPAADSDSLITRTLTFLYLPVFNTLLLVFPANLSFDWSMNAIPLVESFTDWRIMPTMMFYISLSFLANHVLKFYFLGTSEVKFADTSTEFTQPVHPAHNVGDCRRRCRDSNSSGSPGSSSPREKHIHLCGPEAEANTEEESRHFRCVMLGLAFLILPYIPATNLFFYVGFVVAERILYLPSMGFILLLTELLFQAKLHMSQKGRNVSNLYMVIGLLLSLYSVKTYYRCYDWHTEEQLYISGISVNPAKAYGNLANILSKKGLPEQAEQSYKSALYHRSNMADVHYNLAVLLQDQEKLEEALQSYESAITYRPRLTVAYLNKAIVLAMLSRVDEALAVYNICASMDISGLRDPRLHESARVSALYNMGRLYAEKRDYHSAIHSYERALSIRPDHYSPQSIYNLMGESYYHLGQFSKAEILYKKSLQSKPDHIPAHLTMAKLKNKQKKLRDANVWYLKAIELDKTDLTSHEHYANFLTEIGEIKKAHSVWVKAYEIDSDNFDIVFNLATSYRQLNLNSQSERLYHRAVQLSPESSTAQMNLGAIYHLNKKYELAEKSYLRALKLNPDDQVTVNNLRKLRNILSRR